MIVFAQRIYRKKKMIFKLSKSKK